VNPALESALTIPTHFFDKITHIITKATHELSENLRPALSDLCAGLEYRSDILKSRHSRARRLLPRKPQWGRSGRVLYLFLIPLFVSTVIALFGGRYGDFLVRLIGFVLLLATAASTARGIAEERVYHKNAIARAPGIPYKTLAMILLGITVVYLAFVAGGKPLLPSLFVGLLGSVGYGLYYGLDPRRDKLPDMGDISPELVLKTLNEARTKLDLAETGNARITDRVLHRKLDQAIEQAHQILEAIEQDPKDLRVARKFLIVFIDGIADVTQKYNEVDEADISEEMRSRLHRLIDDVQNRFDKELARLKANNLFDLDVSIDALKAQINH